MGICEMVAMKQRADMHISSVLASEHSFERTYSAAFDAFIG